MKKPLIALIQHERNCSEYPLAKLRPVLEQMNYQVAVCLYSTSRQIAPALKGVRPDLIFLDRPLMPGILLPESRDSLDHTQRNCPQIVLGGEQEALQAADSQGFLLDIVALHGLIRKHLARYPRRHLRMSTHLPCLFSSKGVCHFGEILSLGTGGAFIKTMGLHIRAGDLLDVGIPLMGMQRELEVRSQVVYLLTPGPENNYLQGIGVEFLSLDREISRLLQDFIRHALAEETDAVAPCRSLAGSRVPVPKASANFYAAAPSWLQLRS